MKKKIKDLTQEEINRFCDRFEGKCQTQLDSCLIGVCPLKCGWKCVLKTKAYKVLNEEVEV